MPSRKNVQTTHTSSQLRLLHRAVLEIVAVINRPQRDEFLIKEAGIALDRALFPLLVGIERFGPIGVVEMADRVGRDYTTVSRQFSKLETLGLIERQTSRSDRRKSEAVITAKAKAMTDRVDEARERLVRGMLKNWKVSEIDELVRLVRKFADALTEGSAL